MISACAIIAGNYLPYVRVLADSFFAHHPDGSLTVLLVDDEARQLDPGDTRIEWRRLHDIGLDPVEIHRLAGIYDVTELATAVKPLLLRWLLDQGRSEVIYLDPDIRVFASLADVAALARQHGVVLTPHTMEPLPKDGRQIDDLFILAAGVYNLGFVAVGQASRPFLEWWWQSTRREALIDITRMMFTDQRWVDFVPSLFDPYILKDPGYNVAYWNLHARRVTVDGDRYLVDGVPLRFFHFSGFETDRPWLLSRHQGERPRVLLSEHPVLARICKDYAAALWQAGLDGATTRPYGWQMAAAGFALNWRMRRLYWQSLRAAERGQHPEPPDPFDATHPEAFVAWLNSPAETGPRRVSRYLYSIYLDRADLRVAFPDIYGVHATHFAEWVWREGAAQEQILMELLPPRAGDDVAASESTPAPLKPGLNIAGYFRGEMGTGEAARLLVRAADAAGIPRATVTVEGVPYRQQHPFEERAAGGHPYDISILCVNADATPRVARDIGPAFFAGRHTVGYWFWEVDPFPPTMYDAFHHVDEVWAATDYMADIIRTVGWRPVYTVPMPIRVPVHSPEITRTRLGLPEDRFLFLALSDFLSVAPRKNPLGLIAAFTAAFAPNEGPVLVLKSTNGHLRLSELEQVRMAVAGRPDIIVLDQYFRAVEKDALLRVCDGYVSLHRAEGLGLTMAEAMTLGKPVIATGYSGNRHFMTAENSYLVDYTLEAIPAGCGPYPEGGRWAAPDLDHAARLLREVYERPGDALRRARRGQADILDRHGVRTAAAALTRRVEAIREERRPRIVVPDVPVEALAAAAAEADTLPVIPEPTVALAVATSAQAPASASAPTSGAPPASASAPAFGSPESVSEPGAEVQAPLAALALVREPQQEQAPAREARDEGCEGDQHREAAAGPTPAAIAALDTLVPLLEQLGAPRLSAEGRAWPGARIAAQRVLFRLLRPYWFQQRQFQEALIGALVSSVKTLSHEVATLRTASETAQAQNDAQLQTLTEAKSAAELSLTRTEASLAKLSDRIFAVPYVAGRERFVQRGPAGDVRLGYGGAAAANGSNGHAQNGAAHNAPAQNGSVQNGSPRNGAPRNGGAAHHDATRHDVEHHAADGKTAADGNGTHGTNGAAPGASDRHNGVLHAIAGGNGGGHGRAEKHGAEKNGVGQNGAEQKGAAQNGVGQHEAARQNSLAHNGVEHWRAPRVEPLFRIRQRLYLPLLTPRAPVLDIGCGRGGMLDLLRVAKVPAVGIDRDPDMVGHCRAQGHRVEQADALQFLRTQPDASVGSIFSARLIEHLSFEQLQEFLRLCRSRLTRGGLLIAETENPRGFEALEIPDTEPDASSARAIGPELALALCELAGFERAHVLFPTGTGDLDPDRHAQRHYTLVATADSSD